MQKFLIIKLAVIGVLCLLFLMALAMISGLVDERKGYESQVIEEIALTQIGTQTVTTPFIVIEQAGKQTPILPSKSEIVGNVAVKDDQYARGIYHATSYQSTLSTTQRYEADFGALLGATVVNNSPVPTAPEKTAQSTPAQPALPTAQNGTATAPVIINTPPSVVKPAKPTATLVIPVSDLRGVSLPTVTINGKAHPAKFATKPLYGLGGGREYLAVALDTPSTSALDIKFELSLAGLSSLQVVPLGDDYHLTLAGDWQEPKFHGNALPTQKTLNETGFLASWQTPFLSQQNGIELTQNFAKCEYCSLENFHKIHTDFVNMDNIYIKTDRTIKYALILLLVSFGTFFLFEVIKGLKIHPIQYLLVSAGLLTFYVLLLSLAELIAFWQAYLIASLACVGLIAWYASFLLKSVARSATFGAILGGLYAGFYMVLSVGEMNLLLGAVFCFVLLFVVMFITRKIDWYQLSDNKLSSIGMNDAVAQKTKSRLSNSSENQTGEQ